MASFLAVLFPLFIQERDRQTNKLRDMRQLLLCREQLAVG